MAFRGCQPLSKGGDAATCQVGIIVICFRYVFSVSQLAVTVRRLDAGIRIRGYKKFWP